MSRNKPALSRPGPFKRLAIAGVNLLAAFQLGLLVVYLAGRLFGGSDSWFAYALGYIVPWLFIPLLLLLPAVLLRRSLTLAILVAIPTVLFALLYGNLYLPRLPVRPSGPTFTIMTYNVFFRNPHPEQVIAVIEAHSPDVLGLHELAPAMARDLESQLAERYPYRRTEDGRGLFSRYPILQYEAFRLGQGEGQWAQQCLLDIDGYQVGVLSVHPRSPGLKSVHPFGLPVGIPTDLNREGHDADIRELLFRVEQWDGPLIVIGDLNLTDQHEPYSALTRLLQDAHRQSGWGMGFTLIRSPSPRIRLPVWRIDYVFHSAELVALRTTVGRDRGGSDHRPVIATLGLRGSGPEGE